MPACAGMTDYEIAYHRDLGLPAHWIPACAGMTDYEIAYHRDLGLPAHWMARLKAR